MNDDRRSFLKKLGFIALGAVASMISIGSNRNVNLLSLADEVHAQDPDNMPDRCRSGSKGLTRCRNHWGACDGEWHACSGHQSGGRGSGCKKTVQCRDHNFNRGPNR
ncbi:hypothetical protein [Thermodesulfovibrio yellowstonii]|uniref:Uncharacterized protein n=1 Tax=Thermodesulfovibrio yellowstonii (strain ATCC 51303 / DSM 11347 / YP87) TaxID=289376 RepID=B5YFQ5_THEYD|nr:hypothetical protein [Thermodesulfovibrio yellowstonii]ACI21528.1 hypothetical protein THEYE_A1289 [Thermodesulfovibrio yellowstonii DSM 11347]